MDFRTSSLRDKKTSISVQSVGEMFVNQDDLFCKLPPPVGTKNIGLALSTWYYFIVECNNTNVQLCGKAYFGNSCGKVTASRCNLPTAWEIQPQGIYIQNYPKNHVKVTVKQRWCRYI